MDWSIWFVLAGLATLLRSEQLLDWSLNDFDQETIKRMISQQQGQSRFSAGSRRTCDRLRSADLETRMRDEGLLDDRFAAKDLETAALYFPSLSDTDLVYSPDFTECSSSSCSTVRDSIIDELRRTNRLSAYDRQRLIDPSLDQQSGSRASGDSDGSATRGPRDQSPFVINWRKQRTKRDSNFTNSMIKRSVYDVGTVMAIGDCATTDRDSKLLPGHRPLCQACRAVAELPSPDYFPRFLNMVICKEGTCLKGHGNCIQDNLEMTVYHNIGDRFCQAWVKETLLVPICCACGLNTHSRLKPVLMRDHK